MNDAWLQVTANPIRGTQEDEEDEEDSKAGTKNDMVAEGSVHCCFRDLSA